ncbi:hypothetical protein MP638_002087 [Amoeboaphelidium occidentale]|nr:hypothetical protein MP638_002087 [Amoeboaphelidium occidentale]
MNVIFYLDGARSKQKHNTHTLRHTARQFKVQQLNNLVDGLKPLQKSCFRITKDHTEALRTSFESIELKTVISNYEADVAIAKIISDMNDDKRNSVVVVSGDSDLIIHNAPLVARPCFNNKTQILKCLNISSFGLIALGILSGNDYCENIKGFGLSKVHQFIISCDADKTMTTKEIINAFTQIHGVCNHFDIAYNVFVNHKEEQCLLCITHTVQEHYEKILFKVDEFKKLYENWKAEQKAAYEIRSLEQLKHLVLNGQRTRFSPLVNAEYGRYKTKLLNKTKISSITGPEANAKDPEETSPPSNPSKRKSKRKAYPKKPRNGKTKKTPRRKKSNMATRSTKSDKPRKTAVHTQATKDMQGLKKQYETKTWKLGTLKACLRRSSLPEDFKSTLLDRIQGVVALINRATYAAVIITELYYKQSTASKDTDDEFLIDVGGGKQYWGNLIAFLVKPCDFGKNGPRLYQKVRKFMDDNKLKFTLTEAESKYVEFIYCKLLHYHGTSVDRIMALHFIGSSTVLAAKVLEVCPEKAKKVEKLMEMVDQTILNKGKKNKKNVEVEIDISGQSSSNITDQLVPNVVLKLSTTGAKKLSKKRKRDEAEKDEEKVKNEVLYKPGVFETYSLVRSFATMNEMLPQCERFKAFPQYSPSHSSVDLTEDFLLSIIGKEDSKEYLADYLVKNGEKTNFKLNHDCNGMVLQHVFGLRSRGYRSYSLIGNQDTQKRFVLMTSFSTDGFNLLVNVIDKHAKKVKHETGPPMAAKDLRFNKSTDIILGLDLGQTYTVGAVSWLPDGSKKILAVKKTALGEPGRLHRNWLNKTKMKDEHKILRDAENSVVGQVTEESDEIYFTRIMERYSTISLFYNSHAVRKRSFEYQCAMQREMDSVFYALISMVGLKPNQKVKGNKRIYVGVGTGDFDSTGSFHTSFLKYFVRKAKPMGLTILGVDEYFTSQKCVRCHDFTESLSMRAKQCPKCKVVFHRDILAADNMCAALSAMLEKGERPEYLCKPPDDETEEATEEPVQDVKKSSIKGRNPKEKDKKDKQEGLRRSSRHKKR